MYARQLLCMRGNYYVCEAIIMYARQLLCMRGTQSRHRSAMPSPNTLFLVKLNMGKITLQLDYTKKMVY